MTSSNAVQPKRAVQKLMPNQAMLAGVQVPALLQTALLCANLGVNSSTIWRWIRERDFPKPIEVGTKVRLWKAMEVDQWLSGQNSTQSGRRKLTGQASSPNATRTTASGGHNGL